MKVRHIKSNLLLIIGLVLALSTPLVVIYLTPVLAAYFCTPQQLLGTESCINNPVPAVLITSFTPLLLGVAFITLSVLARTRKIK